MDDYLSSGSTGRRGTGLVIVVAIHLLLIYGLTSGLAKKIVTQVIEPFKVEKVDEPPPPPEKAPPPPPPDLANIKPFVPPPDFVIQTPQVTNNNAISDTTTKVQPKLPSVGVRQDSRHPITQPEYPPSSKRLGQEGVVGLLLYIGPDGRVQTVQVEKSSGFAALDAAAEREAHRWRFIPAQDEGKPVAAYYRISVRFRLEDAR